MASEPHRLACKKQKSIHTTRIMMYTPIPRYSSLPTAPRSPVNQTRCPCVDRLSEPPALTHIASAFSEGFCDGSPESPQNVQDHDDSVPERGVYARVRVPPM